MIRFARSAAFVASLALAGMEPAGAQRAPTLDVVPVSGAQPGAIVTSANLFADADMRELLRHSFPASLRYRLELWRRGGFFDDLERQADWQLIIQFDPTSERYRVVRKENGKLEDAGSFATLTTAQGTIEAPARVALVPERAGASYYYSITLEIEALSVSDMDQLEQWLRGAKRGTAASAVGSGLRTLMLRMMGGSKVILNKRSAVFVAER